MLRGGLAHPDVNVVLWLCGRQVVPDFRWPEHRFVVEADGAAWHDNQLAREDDAERQALLEADGERVLRVTWDQVIARPGQTLSRIRAAGAPRAAARASSLRSRLFAARPRASLVASGAGSRRVVAATPSELEEDELQVVAGHRRRNGADAAGPGASLRVGAVRRRALAHADEQTAIRTTSASRSSTPGGAPSRRASTRPATSSRRSSPTRTRRRCCGRSTRSPAPRR